MHVILNVKLEEVDNNLLNIIKELLSKNVEIVIKKEGIKLEEFDKTKPLDKVIQDFAEFGYNKEFLEDLEEGFKTSIVYTQKNDNQALKE